MNVIYIRYEDMYGSEVIRVVSSNPHLGYTEFDILGEINGLLKFTPVDLYDSVAVEEFEEDLDDKKDIILRILVPGYVADELDDVGVPFICTNVTTRIIDEFMLRSKGNTHEVHKEVLNIAIADNADQEMIEYIWSYFSLPTDRRDYEKILNIAIRDVYAEIYGAYENMKNNFEVSNSESVRNWLKGVMDDDEELIKAIKYLDPKNVKKNYDRYSIDYLRSVFIKNFLNKVFDESVDKIRKKSVKKK